MKIRTIISAGVILVCAPMSVYLLAVAIAAQDMGSFSTFLLCLICLRLWMDE